MGLFSRKNEVYARNTKIAELETDIDVLKEKNEKLSVENSELRAEVANLKSTNNALINDNSVLEGRVLALQAQIESLKKNSDTQADKSVEDDKKKASELKKTASLEYALELKRLKFFCDKFKDKYSLADTAKKAEISEMLTNIIKECDGLEKENSTKMAIDKLYDTFGIEEDKADESKVAENEAENKAENKAEEIFDDSEFDLDAVINPKGELNLEELCKELGVYKG